MKAAIRTRGEIQDASVFPEMWITRGAYPDNIGYLAVEEADPPILKEMSAQIMIKVS